MEHPKQTLYVLASFVKPDTLTVDRLADVSGRPVNETQVALDEFINNGLMTNCDDNYIVIQRSAAQSLVFRQGLYDPRLPEETKKLLTSEIDEVGYRCLF